jgi:hypothetical protein
MIMAFRRFVLTVRLTQKSYSETGKLDRPTYPNLEEEKSCPFSATLFRSHFTERSRSFV